MRRHTRGMLVWAILALSLAAGNAIPGTVSDSYENIVRATITGPDDPVPVGESFTLTTIAERLSSGGLFWYLYENATWSYNSTHGVDVSGGSLVAFDYWFSKSIDEVDHSLARPVGTYKYTLVVSNAFAHSRRAVAVDYPVTVAEPKVDVDVDVKPLSYPNPLNTKSGGVVSVAILGTADLDVDDVRAASVALEGVPALRWSYEDVAAPSSAANRTPGPDGYRDLVFKFDKKALVAAVGAVSVGQVITVTITGELQDGTPIEGDDVMVIRQ